MFERSKSLAAACGLAFLLVVPSVAGNSFSVNPVRVTLSADQLTNSLSVRNNSAEPTTVQLDVLRWSQSNGEDVLEATRDILATPPIFTIPPDGTQIIRLGLRRSLDPVNELTYRLLIKELPPASREDLSGVRIALHMSLPIFVLPVTPAKPLLAWSAAHQEENRINVSVVNNGKIHVKVANIRLELKNGVDLGVKQLADYVLAGESRVWPFEIPIPLGAVLNLAAQTDAGEFRSQIQLNKP